MAYHKNNALDLFNDFRSLFSYYGEVPFWSGLIKYCNFYELNSCIDTRPFFDVAGNMIVIEPLKNMLWRPPGNPKIFCLLYSPHPLLFLQVMSNLVT